MFVYNSLIQTDLVNTQGCVCTLDYKIIPASEIPVISIYLSLFGMCVYVYVNVCSLFHQSLCDEDGD